MAETYPYNKKERCQVPSFTTRYQIQDDKDTQT